MWGRWRRATPPRVSVVVPLYNHARFIGEALRSVLAQGAVVGEVIVLDDGSTDDGAAVASRIAAGERRVRVARQENAGAHAALNTALAWCQGEVLAILNSDDAWEPGRLAALLEALDRGAEIAASAIAFMDDGGQPIANPWYEAAWRFWREGAAFDVALANGNFLMTTSNIVMRREVLARIGGFAPLRYTHDLDWLLRAQALGCRITVLDRPLLRYRLHPANTIKEDHRRVRADWAISAAAWLTLLWDRADAPPPDWDLAAAAAAVLRSHALDQAAALGMAYLRRTGAVPLDRSALATDAAFRARLEALV